MAAPLDMNEWEVVQPAAASKPLDMNEWEEVAASPAVDSAVKDVSKAESFFRGLANSATFGFADEIVGAVESAVGPKTYEQARDESRANFRSAREANPWTSMAGDVTGSIATSFIPGVGIAKGASLANMAGKAALQGTAQGLGDSEAKDVGDQIGDAVKGGLVSGGTAGVVGRITRGAPERAVKRALGDITDGVPATMRDRLVGKGGKNVDNVMGELKDSPAIKAAKGDVQKLVPAISDAMERVGGRLDALYTKAGTATDGIPVKTIMKTMDKIASGFEKDPGKLPMARAIRAKMDDVWQAWGERGSVGASDLRVFAKDLGDEAFRGSPAVAPAQAKAAVRDLWAGAKGLIDKNIDEAAKVLGDGRGAKELRALNERMSTLMNMHQAAVYRATREATESTRLKDRVSQGLDVGLALMDPTTFAAKKAYDFVGKPVLRSLDDRLAALVSEARNGSTRAEIAQRAVEFGMAPAVGERIYQWAAKTLEEP